MAEPGLPSPRFEGLRIFPNPFNPQVNIFFDLPTAGVARVAVHDLRGRLVARLAEGIFPAGRQEVTWSGRDLSGRAMPSGTYLIGLETEAGLPSRKIQLVR